MSNVYTDTREFNLSLQDQYVIANAPSSTGTLELQVKVGDEWSTVGAIAAGEAKAVVGKRTFIRLLVTGAVKYAFY